MKKKIKYILLNFCIIFLIILFLSVLTEIVTIASENWLTEIDSNYEEILWNNTIKEYLNSPLWIDNYIYDAGHFLMIPLHSAFNSGNREWIAQFIEFVNRFIFAYTNGEVSEKRLDRLQFFYLLSQYLVKAEKENINVPEILPVILYKEVKKYWLEEPAWQWNREDFPNGIKERILWKLIAKDCKKSFYKAIIDEELFLFTISSDLITYSKLNNNQFGSLELLNDIYNTTNAVFRQRVKWNNLGGWVFQPGVWRDHGNYKYAGQKQKEISMSEMKIDNIAPDSPHGTRFPLWLISLYEAGSLKSEKVFYKNLKEGLGIQFFSKVLILPDNSFPAYRTTNYMDGYCYLVGGVFLDRKKLKQFIKKYQTNFPYLRR